MIEKYHPKEITKNRKAYNTCINNFHLPLYLGKEPVKDSKEPKLKLSKKHNNNIKIIIISAVRTNYVPKSKNWLNVTELQV